MKDINDLPSRATEMGGTMILLGQTSVNTVSVLVCGLWMPAIERLKKGLGHELIFGTSLLRPATVAKSFHQNEISSLIFELEFKEELPSVDYMLDDIGKKFQKAIDLWKQN